MFRLWLLLSGLFGASAVAIGALAAHALEQSLSPRQLTGIETGAHYHLIHAVALLGVAWLSDRGQPLANTAGILFSIGIVLFAGSLYVLPFSQALPVVISTPFGGGSFILGWVCLALGALRDQRS